MVTRSHARSIYRVAPAATAAVAASGSGRAAFSLRLVARSHARSIYRVALPTAFVASVWQRPATAAFSLRLVTRSHALCRVAPVAAVAASSMGGYSNILAQIAYEVARMQYRSSIGSCCRRPAAIQERPVAALAAAVASMQAS